MPDNHQCLNSLLLHLQKPYRSGFSLHYQVTTARAACWPCGAYPAYLFCKTHNFPLKRGEPTCLRSFSDELSDRL